MAFVQQNGLSADPSATSIATSLTGVAAGSLLIVAISHGGTSSNETITDTLGNTYTQIGVTLSDGTNNQLAQIYYAKNVSAGSPTITCSTTGSRNFRRIIAAEYSGMDTTSPLDQQTGQQVSVGSTATDGVTSGDVLTTTNGQTIVGVVMDTSGVATQSAGTGFTKRGGYGGLSLEDLVQTTAGTTDATWTFSAANSYIAFVATFAKAAASTQVLSPSADSADGAWTDDGGGTTLAAAIDEATASDTDYIRSEDSPSASGCRVKLASGTDPSSSTGHVVHWRVKKDSAGETINMTVKLYQGGGDTLGAGTLIASFTRNDISEAGWNTYDETLSGTEADSITDYTDLYLEFYADAA